MSVLGAFVARKISAVTRDPKLAAARILANIKRAVLGRVLGLGMAALDWATKLDESLVVFSSFKGLSYSDNPRAIYEQMRCLPQFKGFHYVWAMRDGAEREKLEAAGIKTVRFNSLAYFQVLARAKYWVFNAKMAPYYRKRDGQVYLQTWHGTPLKRLAHDLPKDGSYYRSGQSFTQMVAGYDADSKNWDYLISPNEFSSEVFLGAFTIPGSKLLETGYPRLDRLVNASDAEVAELRKKYNIPPGKKAILYAPTWRDNSFSVSGYTFQLRVDFAQWHKELGDDYVVLFKPHYLISNSFEIPSYLSDFVIQVPAGADINGVYLASDALVTDYSSVFFDFARLGKPIYFYMYDMAQYGEQLRGFYLDVPGDLPNDVVTLEDELLQAISAGKWDAARLAAFNARFNPWTDGQSSKRVVQAVFTCA